MFPLRRRGGETTLRSLGEGGSLRLVRCSWGAPGRRLVRRSLGEGASPRPFGLNRIPNYSGSLQLGRVAPALRAVARPREAVRRASWCRCVRLAPAGRPFLLRSPGRRAPATPSPVCFHSAAAEWKQPSEASAKEGPIHRLKCGESHCCPRSLPLNSAKNAANLHSRADDPKGSGQRRMQSLASLVSFRPRTPLRNLKRPMA